MDFDDRQALYKDLLEHNGKDKQIIKAIEELGELQHELCRAVLGTPDIHHITEEIADVEIMLEQIIGIFQINKWNIPEEMYNKLTRTFIRLHEENEDEHKGCTGTTSKD